MAYYCQGIQKGVQANHPILGSIVGLAMFTRIAFVSTTRFMTRRAINFSTVLRTRPVLFTPRTYFVRMNPYLSRMNQLANRFKFEGISSAVLLQENWTVFK